MVKKESKYSIKDFTIVIPNWNGRDLLARLLPSLGKTASGVSVIVTDDASGDGSEEFVRKTYPDVQFLSSATHTGFSGNVNRGVSRVKTPLLYLLNTDVVPRKGFLTALLPHFADPDVFAVGSMDISHEKDGEVTRGRGLARWEKGFYIHERGETDADDTAWVSGGSGAFRTGYFREMGGMDERFNPFYWEDIDLSYRARKAGYRVVFEKRSVVDHYHRAGKIATGYSAATVKRTAYRNQFLFVWKHARGRRLLDHLVWLPVRLGQTLAAGDTAMIIGFIQACFTWIL